MLLRDFQSQILIRHATSLVFIDCSTCGRSSPFTTIRQPIGLESNLFADFTDFTEVHGLTFNELKKSTELLYSFNLYPQIPKTHARFSTEHVEDTYM